MVIGHFRAAFERYLARPEPDAFLIIEDKEGRFLQFTREGEDVILDLPTQGLTGDQATLANALIVGELGGSRQPLSDGHFAYQLRLPAHSSSLAQASIEVFGRVYRTGPVLPLTVTIDT